MSNGDGERCQTENGVRRRQGEVSDGDRERCQTGFRRSELWNLMSPKSPMSEDSEVSEV